MAESSIARPYAKAAFEYSIKLKNIVSWGEFLQSAAAIVSDSKISQLINNPKMTKQVAIDLIAELCVGHINEAQLNFIRVLANNHRLTVLPEIAKQFELLRKERDKTVAVEIISTFPIAAGQKEKLLLALKIRLQREISAGFRTDKSLIGGTIIRAGDFVIDGSVRSKLERMKASLEE